MRDASARRVLVGVVAAVVVGAVLLGLLLRAGRDTYVRGATEQNAVVGAVAVTELVAAALEQDQDVQALALRLEQAIAGVEMIRVIDSNRRQLLASTAAEDREAGDLPRRLTPAQKPWFDQAKDLEAAVLTNVEEGRARRREILASAPRPDRLELVLPLLTDGRVTGAVQVLSAPTVVRVTERSSRTALAIGLVVCVLLLGALRVLRAGWQRFAVGLLVTGIFLAVWTTDGLDRLAAVRQAGEAAVASRALEIQDSLARLVDRADFAGGDLDPARWNLDQFRQPRATFDRHGVVDGALVDAGFAEARGRFGQAAWLIGLMAIVFYYWVAAGWAGRTQRALRRHRSAYTFVMPAMVGMVLLVFFPFFYGVLLSFTNQTLYNVNQPLYQLWVGLDNYVSILTDFDIVRQSEEGGRLVNYQNFYWTLGFTILWTVSNVSIGVTLGLILALILNTRGLWGKPIYRILLILPWAVPNYITALIWKGMFHSQFGVINQIIQLFGGEPISWFDSWVTSFLAVLATNGWLSFPFMMVVSLGALQSIAADLYEAARVDGAGRWQQFRYVTLPSLKPALVPAVILSVVWTFNMFNIIYLVSQGEPAGATEILITEAYKIAFEQYRYGYAAAYSVVIFLILLVYGTWQNRVTKATEGI